MKGFYWRAEKTYLSAILVLLFSLSISLTSSEYVDCQSLFPDENLDTSLINDSNDDDDDSKMRFPCQRVTTFIAASTIPQYSWTSPHFLEAFSRQRTKTQKVLPTILRC